MIAAGTRSKRVSRNGPSSSTPPASADERERRCAGRDARSERERDGDERGERGQTARPSAAAKTASYPSCVDVTSAGSSERGQRARRVLDPEVPVRKVAGRDPLAVALVDRRVGDPGLADRARDEQQPRREADGEAPGTTTPRACARRAALTGSAAVARGTKQREEHERQEPRRCRGRTSGSARARTRSGSRPVSAASSSGPLRRGSDGRDSREREHRRPGATRWTIARSGMPRAWYCPQSQIENGDSRSSWKPSVRSENVRTASSEPGLEQEDRERRERWRPRTPPRTAKRRRTPQAVGVREPERRDEQRRELRPAGECDERPSRPGGGGEPEAPDEQGGHDRVVRVRRQHVRRERVREPGERERGGEAVAAEPPADEDEPEHDEQVERGSHVAWAAGRASHLPLQPNVSTAGT